MAKRSIDLGAPRPKRVKKTVQEPVALAPQPEEIDALEDWERADDTNEPAGDTRWARSPLWVRVFGTGLVVAVLAVASFELVYMGKVYPGVTANGVTIAGLSHAAADAKIADKAKEFQGRVVTITEGDTNLRIPVASLKASYDSTRAADLAFEYGRQGNTVERAKQQLRALFGRPTNFAVYQYSDAELAPYLSDLAEDVATPVVDASLNFSNNKPQVTPAQSGTRLDLGRLTQMVADRLATSSTDTIHAPIYKLAPVLDTASLEAVTSKLGGYVAGPITLKFGQNQQQIDQKTIISWLQVGAKTSKAFFNSHDLADLYPTPASANIALSKTAVEKYVADLGDNVDQIAQNAGLAMQDGALTVVQPSRTGIKLDRADAVKSIQDSLTRSADERDLTLKLATTQAEVNEDNLESLGIKEQISEGETYFPGSPSTRLTNVRAGAKRFNGVLLKPGETFSFGKLLGDVGPSTGYVPELVILGDHEEKQYGGGLCQVSSTAFRAALAAGLPITERVNHSFAISYYTWPYAAPGVDATIYYPSVDFKFVNDTGHYILMQTTMNGYDLKFDFFGTKTKSGIVRGPTFVTGDSDATKPSRTVFYRDILDMAGNVTKTDTFFTNYKSSKDFPITKQFN